MFLLALGLKWAFISQPLAPQNPVSGGLLDAFIYQTLWKNLHPYTLGALAVLIIVLSGLYFNYLLNSRKMFQRNQVLAAVGFTIITSIFAGVQRLQPGIIMLPFTILIFRYILILYHTALPRTTVVNIGLLAGLGTLLYHPFWWMLPCCLIGLTIMRPFRLNESVLLCISFLIPAYLLLSYEYLTNQWNPMVHWPFRTPIKRFPQFNGWWAAATAISLGWIIAGIGQWLAVNRRALIQTRKSWYMLIIMGIFTIPTLFYPLGNLYEGLTILLLPASALGSHAFLTESHKTLSAFFFWILLGAAVVFSWAILNQKMV